MLDVQTATNLFSQMFAPVDATQKAVLAEQRRANETNGDLSKKLDIIIDQNSQIASAPGSRGDTQEIVEAVNLGSTNTISAIAGVQSELKQGLTPVKETSLAKSDTLDPQMTDSPAGTRAEVNTPDETVDTGFESVDPVDVNVVSLADNVWERIDGKIDGEKKDSNDSKVIGAAPGQNGESSGGGGGILGGLGAMLIPLIALKMSNIFANISTGVSKQVTKLTGFVGDQIKRGKDALDSGWKNLKNSKVGKTVSSGVDTAKKKIGSAWGWLKKSKLGKTVSGIGASPSASKSIGKTAGKGLGKAALKKIPVIGAVAGGIFAAARLAKGDAVGALAELASGAASIVPGIGTAASVAIDAGIMARDVSKSGKKGDYIIRPGQEPLEFSADDTVIATKSKIPTGFSPAGMTATGVGTAMMLGASQIAAPTNINLAAESGRLSYAKPISQVENVLAPQKDTGRIAQDFISSPGEAPIKMLSDGESPIRMLPNSLGKKDLFSKLGTKIYQGQRKLREESGEEASPVSDNSDLVDTGNDILKEIKGGKIISLLGQMNENINQMARELPEAIASIEPSNNTIIATKDSPNINQIGSGSSNISNQRDKHRSS